MMAELDRRQVGLTASGRAALERLTDELGWFDDAQDAARFALSYAIRNGVPSGQAVGVVTQWATNAFDVDSAFQALLSVTYPESTTPVRLMEHLIDEGLKLLMAEIEAGADSPLAFFM